MQHFPATPARALSLLLLTAACQDVPTRLLAPEEPSFVQSPASPVVNHLSDDGQGCTEAKCTLRDAIAFAGSGATITFSVTGTITLTQGELVINKSLSINGPGATSLSVSGNDASRVFSIGGSHTVAISGLTITGGYSDLSGDLYDENVTTHGGGILNQGTLTLQNSIVSGNRAEDSNGGGIYNEGTLTLENSTVSGNSSISVTGAWSASGGGIYNDFDAMLTLTHSTVSSNSTSTSGTTGIYSSGAGIYNVGTATFTHSTISGNSTQLGAGGGILNEGMITLTHSTVSGNSTQHSAGGGIYNSSGGSITLQNSTISGNSTLSSGGGIYNYFDATLTLIHSTASDNSALSGGGSILNLGTVALQNSIVSSGLLCDDRGQLIDGGYNLVQQSQDCTFGTTTRTGVDPMLDALRDNGGPTQTHALLAGSPAIDAIPFGTAGCGISTDQRGLPRPQPTGGACDIGAFELQPPTLTLSINANGTLTKKTGAATISGTVTCSAPTSVPLDATLDQQQTKGKNTTAVTGSGSTTVACDGTTAWTEAVTPASGKFAAGAATATASAPGATSVTRTVQLK